jgi:hypothetical protein
MTSHELANLLLTLPDLPVATHAHNHTYMSAADSRSHGPLKVGLLETYAGRHIVLGDINKRDLNSPNWFVSEIFHGDAPATWS